MNLKCISECETWLQSTNPPALLSRYEVGGSIVHSANKLMVDYLEICNLTKKEGKGDEGGGNGAFSLIRDGSVVWQESENFFINSLRMIWR